MIRFPTKLVQDPEQTTKQRATKVVYSVKGKDGKERSAQMICGKQSDYVKIVQGNTFM